MSVAKVEAYGSPDAMKPEQHVVKQEKEEHDSLDHFIRQAVSFSRPGESPVQLIQLLQALDQQGSSKVSRSLKVDNHVERREHSVDFCNGVNSCPPEVNGIKESVHSLVGNGVSAKGTKTTSEQMQTLKIPEAVVAFAQAAAKANGEPEKYLPGWPLLSPPKVQLQKCDKCSREFCSPINYRRHMRVHRRSLNIDKDSSKNRVFLGAFWDKLSVDEAKETVSFNNVIIEEVAGSSIIKALMSLICKPGFSSLPQIYLKAGSTLLDIVQAKSSTFPISSQALFSVLDDASEKTFLCAGTANSVQKFVFDGEAGKVALEMKNLVACTSFLLEQKLVKAWLADKDAEALRCQKLLVEEEEAAQKRQADLLERKRLKKLRQKEQKAKELSEVDKANSKTGSSNNLEGTLSPGASSDLDLHTPGISSDLDPQFLKPTDASGLDTGVSLSLDLHADDSYRNIDSEIHMGARRRLAGTVHWVTKPTRNAPNGFHFAQVAEARSSVFMKHGSLREPKAVTSVNVHKVWTPKTKPENEEEVINECEKTHSEPRTQSDLFRKSEVLIGSISVMLEGSNDSRHDASSLRWNHPQEKLAKSEFSASNVNRSLVKQWRPISRHENEDASTAQIDKGETKMDGFPTESVESCLASGDRDTNDTDWCCEDSLSVPGCTDGSQLRPFSRHIAEAFLAQRWKEAMAADHVKLVLPPETEASDNLDRSDDRVAEDCHGRSVLGSAENRVGGPGPLVLASTGALKPKFRAKTEKNYRIKYIPKERNNG